MANKWSAILAMCILSSCGPAGILKITKVSPHHFVLKIDGTRNYNAKCLGDLSVYTLDNNRNYTEHDIVYKSSKKNGFCEKQKQIIIKESAACDSRKGCVLRFVSKNGIYKYSSDIVYP